MGETRKAAVNWGFLRHALNHYAREKPYMVWFALDDGFDTHPKVRKAGNAAVGLFVRLGVHATKHLTEGHLDGDIVRDYGTAATIRKLIAVGMLHEHGHSCQRCPQPTDGGYFIHDYLDYNKSRAQIEAAREAARKRQQRGRDTARRNRDERNSDANLSSNSHQNDASFAPNWPQNDPQFEDEPTGHSGMSRRDTHEGATGVPSPPLPSPNYDVADVGERATGSGGRAEQRPEGRPAQAPIDDADFHLTDTMRRWVAATYPALDVDYVTAQFVSHYRATGGRRQSWPDAWQKWVRSEAKHAADRAQRAAGPTQGAFLVPLPGGQPTTARPSTTDQRVAEGLALAARLRAQQARETS